jgi:type II secretory pathway pseudopilin PulG
MRLIRRQGRQKVSGFTLLELVVVMAILIALAAILIPILPEYVGKANQSAAAANMSELEKFIMVFRASYSRNPNHFDSLMTEGGVVGAAGATTGMSKLVPSGGGALATAALTSGQAARLSREGITMVYDLENAVTTNISFHATINPYLAAQPYGSGRSLTNGAGVVVLKKQTDGTYNQTGFDGYGGSVMPGVMLDTNHTYAVFGIGKRCNLVGASGLVKDAPIFGQHKSQSVPSTSYQRYAAVYDIGIPDDDLYKYNAKFVGVIALQGKRIFTSGDLVGTYSDNQFDLTQPPK